MSIQIRVKELGVVVLGVNVCDLKRCDCMFRVCRGVSICFGVRCHKLCT